MVTLITDDGVDIMTGADRTSGWPKGLKIVLVGASALIIIAVTGLMVLFGSFLCADGEFMVGVPIILLGVAFLTFIIFRVSSAYRKNVRPKKDRRK